jgi:hypothetical protein
MRTAAVEVERSSQGTEWPLRRWRVSAGQVVRRARRVVRGFMGRG